MHLLSIFLFSVSSNFDNLIIGISYGIKKIRIPIISNLLIAFITFIGTALSMIFGKSLTAYIPIAVSNVIGAIMIIGIGIAGLIKYFHSKKNNQACESPSPLKNPEKYDKNTNNRIEFREAVSLGLALSINNIGLGIGASIGGLHVLPAAIGSFVFSFIFISIGDLLGNGLLSKIIGKYAEVIASFGIIGLGICELIF